MAGKLSPAPPKKAATKGPVVKANRAVVSDACGPSNTEKTVEVRKIDNGYIVRESSYGPKGYSSRESYSAKPPTIQIAPTKGGK